jgi:hypothetical protein
MCLDRYQHEVHGYSTLLQLQERVKGKLLPSAKMLVHFREKPFSVQFDWKEGGGLAKKLLYVEGENKGNMRVLSRLGVTLFKDPDGEEARRASLFGVKQFGVKLALERTLASMLKAQQAGTLHLHCQGQFKVEKLAGRVCYKFVRTPFNPPEGDDKLNELAIYIDKETWIHVGSELRDVKGELIAEYYFRDLKINPTFEPNQFTEKGL